MAPSRGSLRDGRDRDGLADATGAEGDRSRQQREQRVVAAAPATGGGPAAGAGAEGDGPGQQRDQRVAAAAPDTEAGVEVGAALAHDDLAGLDDLTAEALHAEALGVGVAAAAGGRGGALVSHVVVSPS